MTDPQTTECPNSGSHHAISRRASLPVIASRLVLGARPVFAVEARDPSAIVMHATAASGDASPSDGRSGSSRDISDKTKRDGRIFREKGVEIETYISGQGPPFVILPSYGRDGGPDYDDITRKLVDVGWTVLRPQPRGIARSTGSMAGLTLHDLADDVALVVRSLGLGPATVLGHAYGNLVARMLTTDHPELVKAVVLASAQASNVAPDIAETPFIAGDTVAPEARRLAALRKAFFAPDHDATIWLDGWYPRTLAMQREALRAVKPKDYWMCGTVPLLEIIAEYDPFKPRDAWGELRAQFGNRITTDVVKDAAHALFPEQPEAVANAILPWVARYQ